MQAGGPTTVRVWLRNAQSLLSESGVESPGLSAELILAAALGTTRTRILAQGETPLDPETLSAAERLLARRLKHEPMAYILGTKPFRDLDLRVNPAVLIPRPETEELVDLAHLISPGARRIVDAGTGSGCIALALAEQSPSAILVGIDRSRSAIETASSNDPRQRVQWIQGDWLGSIGDQSLDLVVTNPPYVTSAEMAGLEPQVGGYEPHAALDGGPDGCAAYRVLVPDAYRCLRPGGSIALEGSPTVMDSLVEILAGSGFAEIQRHSDLAGRPRFATARRA